MSYSINLGRYYPTCCKVSWTSIVMGSVDAPIFSLLVNWRDLGIFGKLTRKPCTSKWFSQIFADVIIFWWSHQKIKAPNQIYIFFFEIVIWFFLFAHFWFCSYFILFFWFCFYILICSVNWFVLKNGKWNCKKTK